MTQNKALSIGWNSFLISLLIFFLIPLNLISQNTEDFARYSSAEYIFYGITFTFICSILIFIFFWGISFFSLKISMKLLTLSLGYLIICGFYFSIRSGVIDGKGELQISYLIFGLTILTTSIGTLFFEKKFRLFLWFALAGGVITTFINMITFPGFPEENQNHKKFHQVSPRAKNIFLISFDSLQADKFYSILESNDSYKKEFEDFILFENVTSVAPFTILSVITTKLGYLPDRNINTQTLITEHAHDFITQTLKNADYQVSTYASFGLGESKDTVNIPGFKIAPVNANVYLSALETSFQKYLPLRYFLTSKIKFLNIFDQTSFPTAEKTEIYNLTKQDPHILSHYKTDIIHFDHFTEGLTATATQTQSTAHFHHYLFTHDPITFDSDCRYQLSTATQQNQRSSLQETECGIKKFISFLRKLKEMDTFNNSLIILASDHGYECEYNDPNSAYTQKLSERWCRSRYMPLLMIKPFGNASQPLTQSSLQVSLIDISKTICETVFSDEKTCEKYEGLNVLNPPISEESHKRKILVSKDPTPHMREYNSFTIIDIGRLSSITEYSKPDEQYNEN